jgi:hypothetical protein
MPRKKDAVKVESNEDPKLSITIVFTDNLTTLDVRKLQSDMTATHVYMRT